MRGGGWRGSMSTAGGISRTYGLTHHFERRSDDREPVPLERARIARIAKYFLPYKVQWAAVFCCIAVTSALNVLPPLIVGRIIDRALPAHDSTLLALLVFAMVGIAVTSGLIGVLQQSLTARAGERLIFDLKTALFRHVQRLSLRFFTANRSGEIVSRINNDVNAVRNVASGTLVSIVSNIATLIATATAMLAMDWRLTLMAVAIVPAFYVPSRAVGRIRRRLSMQTQVAQGRLHGFLNERAHVAGVLLTRIYGREKEDRQQFEGCCDTVCRLNIRQAIVGRWLVMILTVFSTVGPALVFWYGGHQVMKGGLQPGQLVAFAALLTLLYRPLVQLATVYADIQGALAVFERIFEYLDMGLEVEEAESPQQLARCQGRVEFSGVSFRYPARPVGQEDEEGDEAGAGRFALNGVSFTIEPGEQVALVGPSGAGKTTITYLLPRFYDPTGGSIALDGVDLRKLPQAWVRQQIAMVTQETFLFHASIRENLLYAKPQASDDELIEACRSANIHDMIAALPDGYDSVVGERGFRLSGGEKQRLSIARALLKDPRILVLDEATSSLDATSEYLIQEALDRLLRGRTSLIIAHRLSTILHSDRIVVMERGRVVESGSHTELISKGRLYADLFAKQFEKVLGPQV